MPRCGALTGASNGTPYEERFRPRVPAASCLEQVDHIGAREDGAARGHLRELPPVAPRCLVEILDAEPEPRRLLLEQQSGAAGARGVHRVAPVAPCGVQLHPQRSLSAYREYRTRLRHRESSPLDGADHLVAGLDVAADRRRAYAGETDPGGLGGVEVGL